MDNHYIITTTTKDVFCYNCLNENDGNAKFQLYQIGNETLRRVFQCQYLCLCYLCKRKAQQVEAFIENVQRNQTVLENLGNFEDISFYKSQLRLNPQLTHVALDANDLSDKSDEAMEEERCDDEDKNDIDKEPSDDEQDEKVKPDVECITIEVDTPYIPTKKEKREGKKRAKRKCVKSREDKEKKKKDDTEDFQIETISITREECMEERRIMAADSKYTHSMYKCEDCLKGFTFKESFEKHMEKHNKNIGEFECDICRQRFPSKDKLSDHMRFHSLRYRCSICKLTRIAPMTIKDHYKAFHCNGRYQYSCKQCNKVYNRQSTLRKHIKLSHGATERRQCAYCHKTCANDQTMKAHLVGSHPELVAARRPRRHVCGACGRGFCGPAQLRSHATTHADARDFYCVECNKSFKSESILKRHLKNALPHRTHTELPLKCEHCDLKFSVKRDLENHTNRVHLHVRPYQCDVCDKSYVTMWSLKDHKRTVHEGYKRPYKFPCTMCDKVFNYSRVLKNHIRAHTGERPFQCSLCPAQFGQASVLGTHVRLIHLRLTRDGRPKTGSKRDTQ